MPAQFVALHQTSPDKRRVKQVVDAYKDGAIVIIPTDSIYAVSCDLRNKRGVETICKLLGKKVNKANLSLLCKDLSDLATYCKPLPNPIFKLMRRLLPGPYTFVLRATSEVAKVFKTNKKTVGIRVPDNEIVQALLEQLGNPIISSSIHAEDEVIEYLTDPDEIYAAWQHKVDIIIDGGPGKNQGSTVLDCTDNEAFLIREGLGMDKID